MAMVSLVTNSSCLCISVLKCRKATSDEIIDEVYVLEGYSKQKDIDLERIDYIATDLLCRPAWKVKYPLKMLSDSISESANFQTFLAGMSRPPGVAMLCTQCEYVS